MNVLFINHEPDGSRWRGLLEAAQGDFRLLYPDDAGDPAAVEYAIVGRTRPGDLAGYPNLRAILSLWAGVEHLLADPTIPETVPIVRMVEPSLTRGMVEYVNCQVLNVLLSTADYGRTDWSHPQKLAPRGAPDLPVGIMGMGVLGQACARALGALGFPVSGWSRSGAPVEGVPVFAGRQALPDFLGNVSVVVLLLPRTADTENLVCAETLAMCRPGSALINAGRGELVVDEDLLAALDDGRIGRAVLDVFRQEPLPPSHPYWAHPRVTVTPHVASVTDPRTAVPVLLDNLARLRDGAAVGPLVARARGY